MLLCRLAESKIMVEVGSGNLMHSATSVLLKETKDTVQPEPHESEPSLGSIARYSLKQTYI